MSRVTHPCATHAPFVRVSDEHVSGISRAFAQNYSQIHSVGFTNPLYVLACAFVDKVITMGACFLGLPLPAPPRALARSGGAGQTSSLLAAFKTMKWTASRFS